MKCICGYEVKFCPDCGRPLTTHAKHTKEIVDQGNLITVKELEQFLKISTPTAYELIHSKGFPTVKMGPRKYRVDKTRLMNMIQNGYILPAR